MPSAAVLLTCTRPSMACLCLTSFIPRSESVLSTEPPASSILVSPSTNDFIASDGSSFQCFANWSADSPEMLANCSSLSPPLATAVSMLAIVRENAVPAASDPCPVDARAVDHASIWSVVNPTMFPSEPILVVMSRMSDSSAALLLPSLVSEFANESYSSDVMCVMLASWPSSCAACWASVMLVAMLMFDIARENASRLPVAMPSCPPIASMSRIWSADVKWVRE